ncbi:hypothetical protein M422DRAFT_244071 [Sphaerobolus stellatus SS14]|nr:hypothetical protein M422DRAFT_244071 [Sphaerobolus stellatus SS14]
MSSTTVTRAVTKMVRSYFTKPEKSFPIVEQAEVLDIKGFGLTRAKRLETAETALEPLRSFRAFYASRFYTRSKSLSKVLCRFGGATTVYGSFDLSETEV